MLNKETNYFFITLNKYNKKLIKKNIRTKIFINKIKINTQFRTNQI